MNDPRSLAVDWRLEFPPDQLQALREAVADGDRADVWRGLREVMGQGFEAFIERTLDALEERQIFLRAVR